MPVTRSHAYHVSFCNIFHDTWIRDDSLFLLLYHFQCLLDDSAQSIFSKGVNWDAAQSIE